MVKNEKRNCEIGFPCAHFGGTGSVSGFYDYVGSEIDKQVEPMPPGKRRQEGRKRMRKTTNGIQESYMVAKALLETLEAKETEIDRQYMKNSGILNPDGNKPELVECIDDQKAFNKANEELSNIIVESGLWGEILAAREALEIAEAKLIKFGLSIVPAKEREVLSKAAETNYTTRLKIIDLVLKLDVSTIGA